MKRLVLLGATGSIGVQTIDVVRQHPDRFELAALSAGRNIAKLREILDEFPVSKVCVQNEADARDLHESYPEIQFFHGDEGLTALAAIEEYDVLVNALVGFVGFLPTLTAIQHHHDVALANKETLVVGGELIYAALKEYGQKLYPIDSEHSAIFQCLQGEHTRIEKLILTASGGPFRNWNKEDIAKATRVQALNHPNWDMGAKVTIDSASMMNKGLEMIEASWLFNMSPDDIEIVVHPQSIVHSMVQFTDGCLKAQLGAPDMRVPIQYALSYPERVSLDTKRLSFAEVARLDFFAPDSTRFPAIDLAYSAHRVGGNMACIMNGANEVAVDAFLKDRILFCRIPEIIEKTMEKATFVPLPDIDDIYASHQQAKEIALSLI